MTLTMDYASSGTIAAGGLVTQLLKVRNPKRAKLKMRMKISFLSGSIPISDQEDVTSFTAQQVSAILRIDAEKIHEEKLRKSWVHYE